MATVRGQVPLALFLLEHGADPNVGDAGFTPLHWAAGTWESGVSNPVYGFSDPMSGIPTRQAKLQLVKALLAHGANPNGRMTRRPPGFAGGYEDAPGATPFLLASAAADLEMMRILLAAGADPALVTDTKTTPVMAASGLNRGIGESPITEEQALATVRFLLELGADARGATTNGENALFGAAYRGWNTLLALLIDKGADVNAVSKAGVTPWLAASGFGDRLGGVLYNKEGADLLLEHGADPKLGQALSGPEQVPVTIAIGRRRSSDRRARPSQGCRRAESTDDVRRRRVGRGDRHSRRRRAPFTRAHRLPPLAQTSAASAARRDSGA